MSKLRKKYRISLMLGLFAGVALMVGIIFTFDTSLQQVMDVVGPALLLLAAMALLGLCAAALLIVIKRFLAKRR